MHPKDISIIDYTYHLPEEKIAKYPLAERDSSKLLIFKNGTMETSVYKNLPSFLPENTTLVFNNTKVVEARLLFEKRTGSVIEIFCLEPDERYSDITTAMLQKETVYWKCLVGGAKKWKEEFLNKQILYHENAITIQARIAEKRNDYFLIELSWNNTDLSFAEILHAAGVIPLPPYLNRTAEEQDKSTYQTIYAKHDGSVAAPTAGLHFTDNLLADLSKKNIHPLYVTLHVGAGTFKPVKAATMHEHEMHAEFIDVTKAAIEQLIQAETIIATGTTSLRTIESLYWMGVKAITDLKLANLKLETLSIQQWDAYELPQDVDKQTALQALLNWMNVNNLDRIICKTQIIIAPGYTLKIADGLITNFHQPQSTLLLLIAAIVGNEWKTIYNYALANEFRFLSYGDGSLLWK
ncbi:MAG: S-adenosylmethionine:tRNA ribosyltransferase-isomerase [Chitinophagaceae bacterium]|jgi:S-adenosylmethionine:tRNA ribosyltransferase-isomerase|nr:S-adenosylmethionine:tRNA ribosyltransferase-isomerase [Chitinophagaceae bacterium]